MSTARYIVGDTREVLRSMPDASVDCLVTSPPFLALRSYLPADHPDKHREIGSEATPAAFLDVLLDLTEEWGRVLAPHGSICVELGDTYAGSGGAGGDYNADGLRAGQHKFDGSGRRNRPADVAAGILPPQSRPGPAQRDSMLGWPLDKSLTMIPGLYAASLAYGRNLLNPDHTFDPWRVRNLVAWVRPNPPVGALGDKVRPATSYLTWACKAKDRWFDLDAVRGPFSDKTNGNLAAPNSQARTTARAGLLENDERPGSIAYGVNPAGAPPLDWWQIPPGGYTGSHYAVFPEELCRIPIEASCPRRVCRTCGKPSRRIVETDYRATGNGRVVNQWEGERRGDAVNQWTVEGGNPGHAYKHNTTTGWTSCGCPGTDGIRLDGFHDGAGWRPGIVLDPFGGTGTVGIVATGRGRDCILIDIDSRNADLARERLGLFLTVEDPYGVEV